MTEEPALDRDSKKSFPLRDGALEVGETISNTFLRIPLWRDVPPPSPEHVIVVPGVRILDACGMWLGETFGPGAFLHRIERANFSEFLSTEEPMTAVCQLEKVTSGSRGISARFTLTCTSVIPGQKGIPKQVAQMEFTMFRPAVVR